MVYVKGRKRIKYYGNCNDSLVYLFMVYDVCCRLEVKLIGYIEFGLLIVLFVYLFISFVNVFKLYLWLIFKNYILCNLDI